MGRSLAAASLSAAHHTPYSRRSRRRIANPRSISSSEKNHGLRFEGSLKSICKEIALQRPKSGANSIACARLEPISKSPEDDNEAGELNKASALPLHPGEEALNEPADSGLDGGDLA
jgi:hypothetical protein